MNIFDNEIYATTIFEDIAYIKKSLFVCFGIKTGPKIS